MKLDDMGFHATQNLPALEIRRDYLRKEGPLMRQPDDEDPMSLPRDGKYPVKILAH